MLGGRLGVARFEKSFDILDVFAIASAKEAFLRKLRRRNRIST